MIMLSLNAHDDHSGESRFSMLGECFYIFFYHTNSDLLTIKLVFQKSDITAIS